MTVPIDATTRQVQAADPAASTWLSANAGSGKTRVLTDRVARLLLNGVEPQHILCLTYTKAAASEMQNRLFQRLGAWAMLDERALHEELGKLGIEGGIDAQTLTKARRLFARAIETPGGLKIQTIHSFCSSLLRRFPLEAGVTPQFVEMEERSASLLRAEIVEEMASGPEVAIVDDLARHLGGEDFDAITAELSRHRTTFSAPLSRAEAFAAFGVSPDLTEDDLLKTVFLGGEEEWLADVVTAMNAGLKTDKKDADKLSKAVAAGVSLAALVILEDVLLTGESAGSPFSAKTDSVPTKKTAAALGPLKSRLDDLMLRVEDVRRKRVALLAAEKTFALHQFAGAFLPEFEARKAARGWLDFDDLIQKARALLTDPSVAQWVLFRLDGGIDHILVDEAQDTSPEQWRVIELLAQEFTTGSGARSVPRTIFVVGDKKQSIYSFQGADLRKFEDMRSLFSARLNAINIPLADLTLEYSFRSADAILRLVDLTFDERRSAGLGGEVKHRAARDDLPGRVDLWPVVEKADDPDPGDWFDPVDHQSNQHPNARLARQIAGEIRRMIDSGVQLQTRTGPRRVTEGDFLILVQRRSVLFQEIIRACKVVGLAIAGADRLKLGAELAVKDLAALLSFLATPEDSLSLAAALRSPLFGWAEGALFNLANRREGSFLWEALRQRRAEFGPTMAILDDLRKNADFLRPYDLVERVLTRHDGRRKLLGRLGPEAEDGIDQFLGQALAYERMEVPSLTGFLGWLETDEIEVKRQPDSAGGRIRVMTVHGAKGLEAPIVILPDTAERNLQVRDEILPLGQGHTAWKTRAAESPPRITAAVGDLRQLQQEENLRLLYVAMTRAESWLIVCAAGKVEKDTSWYARIEAGLKQAGAEPFSGSDAPPFGPVLRYATGAWPPPNAREQAGSETPDTALPDWAERPAPAPGEAEKLLSPSGLGGAKALAGQSDGLSEEAALRRGRQLHLLLEHLPLWPETDWPRLAFDLLSNSEDAAPGAETAEILAEARSVLAEESLRFLFTAEALVEVEITAEVLGRRMLGVIDRLIVGPDRVLAVDYKSNATVPDTADAVPAGILRQMGAYAAALAQIYPDRAIETAILWTRTATLMPLPHDLVSAALRDTTFP